MSAELVVILKDIGRNESFGKPSSKCFKMIRTIPMEMSVFIQNYMVSQQYSNNVIREKIMSILVHTL
jgi:hypothetical protein